MFTKKYYQIPEEIQMDWVSSKDKFLKVHQGHYLPCYTFYAYWARYGRNKNITIK
ncbi:MAG: hypothetical protein UR28_C0028G0021 [Candidatus Peregrinibacteria bacterium GW2011_GWF2_33_10]|nr:MAG: hypothetical protein UR28_C0028G0021 [Candidatus Peregrinibacteria bacterium GW2011_GWF2_33_10]